MQVVSEETKEDEAVKESLRREIIEKQKQLREKQLRMAKKELYKRMIEGCKGSKERDYMRGFCEGIVGYSLKKAKELNLCIPAPMNDMTVNEIAFIVGSHLSKTNNYKFESQDEPIVKATDDLFKCK